MTISVLVVDDQAMVRAGFAAILDAQHGISVVGQAADGAEAIGLARSLRPDVVLMDVRMPNLNGIDATRELVNPSRGEPYVPRVLVLTTFDADDYVYDALAAGASGFLLKDAPPDELLTAIRTVHSGDAVIAPSSTKRLLEHLASVLPAPGTGQDGQDGGAAAAAVASLTGREREVLELMARGRSNTEIGQDLFVAEATVKTHVGRVLAKLGARDRVQAVVVAYEAGLVKPGA
ncbi:MAG: response regulator transcription factor [Promicromonosporaceae bacterium]|nr:response regulator transcription factor [Promicromonosporaceae bacterium]